MGEHFPCIMSYATVDLPHVPWVAQQGICPMVHGLHASLGSIPTPCTMGCTTGYLPMAHGLCNSISTPWFMGCATVLSRREVSARQDAMTYLVRVRRLLADGES